MTDTETLTDEQEQKFLNDERAAEAASEASAEQEQETGQDESQADSGSEAEKQDESGQEQKTVPYGALHAEREKRKAAQDENKQLSSKLERIEAMLAKMETKPEDKGPAFDDDPMAYLKQRVDAHDAQQQQVAAQQQFMASLKGYEDNFRQQNPDYLDAVQFAKAARLQELQAMGYDNAAQIVQQEAVSLAGDLMRQGKDPAAGFYSYAKSRGFQGKVVDKMQAREQTKSIGGVGGQPPRGKYTLEQLSNMNVDDPNWDAAFKAVMGNS